MKINTICTESEAIFDFNRIGYNMKNIDWQDQTIKKITFEMKFNGSIEDIVWPKGVEYIVVDCDKPQAFDKVKWPETLKQIDYLSQWSNIYTTSLFDQFNKINIFFNRWNKNICKYKQCSDLTINIFCYNGYNERILMIVPINVEELNVYYKNKETKPNFKVPYGCKITETII